MGVRERRIEYKQGKLHAAVQAPTYFMRMIRVFSVNVEASAAMAEGAPPEVAASK